MARQQDVRYINSYVSGSVAYKMEEKTSTKNAVLPSSPKPRAVKEQVIKVNPMAICGIALAVVLLVMLGSGYARLMDARAQEEALQQYVDTLQQKKATLEEEYKAGYDLEEIRQMALAMGLVPVEEVEHISISLRVPMPPVEEDVSGWEAVAAFLAGLFA